VSFEFVRHGTTDQVPIVPTLGALSPRGGPIQDPVLTLTSPQSGIKSPFSGPGFVLALAGIRRRVVQIQVIEKDDLPPTDHVCFLGRKSPRGIARS